MPAYNELGRGKLGIGIEKVFGIAAPGALRSLSPELSSVVQLPVSAEELMGVSGWGRWSSGFTVPANAAGYPRWQIRNPATSGAIVIIERVMCACSNIAVFSADGGYAMATDLLNAPTIDFRDGRTNPRAGAAAQVTYEFAATALTATASQVIAIANTVVEFPIFPILLMPGNGYLFGGRTINVDAYVTVVWRERGAPPAEVKAV